MAAPLAVPAGPAPDGVGAFLHQHRVHTAVTLPSLAHMGTHPVYQPPVAAAAAGTFTGGALGTTGWWNAHGQGRYPANWAALTPMARHTWIDAMITAGGGVISQATGVPVGGRCTAPVGPAAGAAGGASFRSGGRRSMSSMGKMSTPCIHDQDVDQNVDLEKDGLTGMSRLHEPAGDKRG